MLVLKVLSCFPARLSETPIARVHALNYGALVRILRFFLRFQVESLIWFEGVFLPEGSK